MSTLVRIGRLRPPPFTRLTLLPAVLAGCGGNPAAPAAARTTLSIERAGRTVAVPNVRAGFYPYIVGPSSADRAVYLVVGDGPRVFTAPASGKAWTDSGGHIELFKILGPDRGEVLPIGTYPLDAPVFVSDPAVQVASGLFGYTGFRSWTVDRARSSLTLDTARADRMTGRFTLVLTTGEQGAAPVVVTSRFSADRAADFDVLPFARPQPRQPPNVALQWTGTRGEFSAAAEPVVGGRHRAPTARH